MSSRFGCVFRHGKWIDVEIIRPDTPARSKVEKLTKTWAQIPHGRGLKLAKQVRSPAFAVLLILESAVHKARILEVIRIG